MYWCDKIYEFTCIFYIIDIRIDIALKLCKLILIKIDMKDKMLLIIANQYHNKCRLHININHVLMKKNHFQVCLV